MDNTTEEYIRSAIRAADLVKSNLEAALKQLSSGSNGGLGTALGQPTGNAFSFGGGKPAPSRPSGGIFPGFGSGSRSNGDLDTAKPMCQPTGFAAIFGRLGKPPTTSTPSGGIFGFSSTQPKSTSSSEQPKEPKGLFSGNATSSPCGLGCRAPFSFGGH
jgi:hypothetical protein